MKYKSLKKGWVPVSDLVQKYNVKTYHKKQSLFLMNEEDKELLGHKVSLVKEDAFMEALKKVKGKVRKYEYNKKK